MKNIPYYVTEVCDGHYCPMDCEAHCPWADEAMEFLNVQSNIFDVEEIHENCTVQILRNTITGEMSVGWWENDEEENNG